MSDIGVTLFYSITACIVAFAHCHSHAVDKSSSQKVSSASDLQEREYSQCMPIAPLVVYCKHVVVNVVVSIMYYSVL